MPREIHLNGAVEDGEAIVFSIGEGEDQKTYAYRLRSMTRDVRKKINAVELKTDKIKSQVEESDDLDQFYDDLVAVFLEGIDILLEIDTSGEAKHRTPASKILKARYEQNQLRWSDVGSYYAEFREEAEQGRPI